MAQVSSRVTIYRGAIARINEAAARALEQTAEQILEDVGQSQTLPFAEDEYTVEKVYGKRGQYAKNGREYKGKKVKRLKRQGGTLQKSTFIDTKGSKDGYVSIVSSTPYARRLYYHPEYKFNTSVHANAKGRWLDDYLPGGKKQDMPHKAFAKFMQREAGM